MVILLKNYLEKYFVESNKKWIIKNSIILYVILADLEALILQKTLNSSIHYVVHEKN